MIEKALVADDDPLLRNFIAATLRRLKMDVAIACDGNEAIAKLKEGPYELVITDLKMPHKNGMDVLKAVKSIHPQTIVLMVTAFASIETAVEAMREGAFNLLIKPFSPEVLEINVQKAEEHLRQLTETRFLREEQALAKCPELVAQSPRDEKDRSRSRKNCEKPSERFYYWGIGNWQRGHCRCDSSPVFAR